MFSNIGAKLKGLAKIVAIIGIVASFVGAAIAALSYGGLVFFGISVIGSLISWVSAFGIYGFGEIIENSQRQTKLLEQLNGIDAQSPEQATPIPVEISSEEAQRKDT